MGVKDSFMGASMIAKIALALLLVANLFNWISFTTSGWAEDDSTAVRRRFGIWRACSTYSFTGCSQLDGAGKDWVGAFQAFAIFGFVGVNVCFALIICFIFLDKCKGDKEAAIAAFVSGIVAAVCWLIAIFIIADEYDEEGRGGYDLDYAFGLAIVAVLLTVGGAIAMFMEQKGGSATKPSG